MKRLFWCSEADQINKLMSEMSDEELLAITFIDRKETKMIVRGNYEFKVNWRAIERELERRQGSS